MSWGWLLYVVGGLVVGGFGLLGRNVYKRLGGSRERVKALEDEIAMRDEIARAADSPAPTLDELERVSREQARTD